MTSSVVTGIIGIQTTGINGIRDIFWPTINGIQDTQTPPKGASVVEISEWFSVQMCKAMLFE